MTIIIFWVFFSLLVVLLAQRRGRSGAGYFLLSLLISPLLTAILLLVLPVNQEQLDRSNLQSGGMKKCPHCAELIKADASVCRYCGRGVVAATPKPSASDMQLRASLQRKFAAQQGKDDADVAPVMDLTRR